MKNITLNILFFLAMLFYNSINFAKNFLEIDYKTIIPAYVEHINSNFSATHYRENEIILARHFLAMRVPELSQSQCVLNAEYAFDESIQEKANLELSVTSRAILRFALEYMRDNPNSSESDKEICLELLDRTYYEPEFASVPQDALDSVDQRILAFYASSQS